MMNFAEQLAKVNIGRIFGIVIAGGGSAVGVLATRLSADAQCRVLVRQRHLKDRRRDDGNHIVIATFVRC